MTPEQIRSTDGTGTLSYLVTSGLVGILIDPNIEDVAVIDSIVRKMGIRITHVVDTHTHADHISAAGEFRRMYGAEVVMHENTKNKWKIVEEGRKFGIEETLKANAAIPVDRYVVHDDTVPVGQLVARVVFTPGHTDNHIALLIEDCLFTGDLLLIGQAGRSDLPGGNAGEQYDSLYGRVLPLPGTTKMYPGHDYEGRVFSLLQDEKRTNPFLQQGSKTEYIAFVGEFFPPVADIMTPDGKMSLQCGTQRVVQPDENVKNVSPRELSDLVNSGVAPLLLDVREPFELVSVGAIEGVQNIPVGTLKQNIHTLPGDKSTVVVCICQSGSRSSEAAHFLHKQGYKNVLNLQGGTSGWIKSGYKVTRPVANPRY